MSMAKRLTRRLCALLPAALAACVLPPATIQTNVLVYDGSYANTGTAHAPGILWRRPAASHVDLAVIEVAGREGTTREQILAALTRQGQKLGADAVVTDIHPGLVAAPLEFHVPGAGVGRLSTAPRLIGVAIRYADSGSSHSVPEPPG